MIGHAELLNEVRSNWNRSFRLYIKNIEKSKGEHMEKKILIVDDALFMRKSIRKILSEGGYTDMEEARDGEEPLPYTGNTVRILCFWISPCRENQVWRCWKSF